MIRTIFSILVLGSITIATGLKAEPSPTSKNSSTPANNKDRKSAKVTSSNPSEAPASTAKWSLVNGVWIHPDGYKFVSGQVVRTASQTQKTPPKPPTQSEIDAAKKQSSAKSAADIAAAKAAEKERNLRPRPASQTGSHL